MKKIVMSFVAFVLLATPALAQFGGPRPNFNYVNDTIEQVVIWTNRGVTFLMVIATILFIINVIAYIRAKEEKEVAEKKRGLTQGIIGLAVIVGIWGIVRILISTIGINDGGSITPSCPPGMVYDSSVRSCR